MVKTMNVDEVEHNCGSCRKSTACDFVHEGVKVCSFNCLMKIRTDIIRSQQNLKGKWEDQIMSQYNSNPVALQHGTVSL